MKGRSRLGCGAVHFYPIHLFPRSSHLFGLQVLPSLPHPYMLSWLLARGAWVEVECWCDLTEHEVTSCSLFSGKYVLSLTQIASFDPLWLVLQSEVGTGVPNLQMQKLRVAMVKRQSHSARLIRAQLGFESLVLTIGALCFTAYAPQPEGKALLHYGLSGFPLVSGPASAVLLDHHDWVGVRNRLHRSWGFLAPNIEPLGMGRAESGRDTGFRREEDGGYVDGKCGGGASWNSVIPLMGLNHI